MPPIKQTKCSCIIKEYALETLAYFNKKISKCNYVCAIKYCWAKLYNKVVNKMHQEC